MQSISQSKFHVLRFEQPSFSFTTCHHHHIVSILSPNFGGGPQESHLTPLATRTTNKELSAESFTTKMKQSYVDRSFMLLRFEQPSFSFITRHRHHSFYFEPYSEGVLEKAT